MSKVMATATLALFGHGTGLWIIAGSTISRCRAIKGALLRDCKCALASPRQPRRCEHIVAPDGSKIVPTSKPQPDRTLVKALARARRWQGTLDEGVYATVSEIGDAENISKS
jgi:hypothetical protein